MAHTHPYTARLYFSLPQNIYRDIPSGAFRTRHATTHYHLPQSDTGATPALGRYPLALRACRALSLAAVFCVLQPYLTARLYLPGVVKTSWTLQRCYHSSSLAPSTCASPVGT